MDLPDTLVRSLFASSDELIITCAFRTREEWCTEPHGVTHHVQARRPIGLTVDPLLTSIAYGHSLGADISNGVQITCNSSTGVGGGAE